MQTITRYKKINETNQGVYIDLCISKIDNIRNQKIEKWKSFIEWDEYTIGLSLYY